MLFSSLPEETAGFEKDQVSAHSLILCRLQEGKACSDHTVDGALGVAVLETLTLNALHSEQ